MAISDDFNRADGDIGSNYERVTGTANFQVSSNHLEANSNFDTVTMRRIESSFPDDQYAQAKCSFTTGANSAQWGVACRIGSSGEGYHAYYDNTNSVTLRRRSSGGTNTFINSATITAAASTLYTLKIEAIGSTIKVYHEGVQVLSETDATFTSGRPALYWNGNTDRPDCDDFECSDPAGQFAAPDSDVSNAGSWTTTNLFEKVDEATASDADFISSPSAPSNAACVLGLSNVTDPVSSTGHKLRVRYRKAAGSSHQMNLTYRLLQGGTQIGTWTATDIGTSFTTGEQTLTGGEADSITDYSDLRVELSANKVTTSPAAPTFVAAGAVASGVGTIAPAIPAGVLANDILLLFVESANQTISLTTANGFAEVTTSPQGTGTAAGTAATRLAVYWKRATGSDSAPTVADSGDHQVGRIIAIRGCKTSGDPWNVTPAGDVAATASTSVTIPGVTTSVNNCMIVVAVSNATDTTTAQTSAWTNSNLSSLTERIDSNATAGNGGGFGVATGILATAGATGSTTATLATSSVQGRMCIALEPAALADTTADVSWIQFEVPDAPAGGSQTLAAVVAGVSTVAGNVNVDHPLAAQVIAQSSVAGSIALALPLASAVAGQSSVAANAGINYAISATITGQSSVAANLLATINLAALVTGQSSAAASFNLSIRLDGTVAGQSVVDGIAAVRRDLSAAIAGLSAVDANIIASMPLAAIVAGQSTVAVDARATRNLSTQSDAQSTVSANAVITRGLAAQIDGVSTAAGNAIASYSLASTIAAQSSIAADLRVDGGFSGAIAAVSTVTGSLALALPLSTASAALSTVAAESSITRGLAAQSAGVSSLTGNVNVSIVLAGVVQAAGIVEGILDGSAAPITLATVVAGQASAAGNIIVSFSLAAIASGQSSAAADARIDRGLSTAVASTAALTGEVAVARTMATVAAGQAAIAGNLIASFTLATAVSGISSVTGSLAVNRPIAAVCAGVSTVAGNLSSTVNLDASINAVAMVAGDVRNAVRLTALSSGLATVTGSLQQDAKFAAVCAAISSNTGALRANYKMASTIAAQSTIAANLELLVTLTEFLKPHQRTIRPGIGNTGATNARAGSVKTIKPKPADEKVKT